MEVCMKERFLATFRLFIASVFMLFATGLTTTMTAFADPPTGNNGTLKVHEIGTPTGTENNDPKVCAFNFEGFGFDPAQSGYINIDVQGGDGPTGTDAGPFAFGPTNNSGYAISQDFNNGAGTTTINNGHYKATRYGKDTGGNVDLRDVKAKSKVFKVEC